MKISANAACSPLLFLLVLAQADIANSIHWVALTTEINFLTVLEAGKSAIKVLSHSVPNEDNFPGLETSTCLLCPHVVEKEREISSFSFFFSVCFLGPHSQHMEVPRQGVKSEL